MGTRQSTPATTPASAPESAPEAPPQSDDAAEPAARPPPVDKSVAAERCKRLQLEMQLCYHNIQPLTFKVPCKEQEQAFWACMEYHMGREPRVHLGVVDGLKANMEEMEARAKEAVAVADKAFAKGVETAAEAVRSAPQHFEDMKAFWRAAEVRARADMAAKDAKDAKELALREAMAQAQADVAAEAKAGAEAEASSK